MIHDELPLSDAGNYAEKKHRLIAIYADLFSASMKAPKWHCLVYIDLFAGAGRAKETDSEKIIDGSPLLSLGVKNPFNKYIFCELDGDKLQALKTRVKQNYPKADVTFVRGNCNDRIHEVLKAVPYGRKDFRVLSFCLADIYKMENLKFRTIEILSERYVDFLVLIPTYMDAHRNEDNYCRIDNHTVDEFYGTAEWRSSWQQAKLRGERFGRFVCQYFYQRMRTLKYQGDETDAEEIRQIKNQSPLYRLAFFSRNGLGIKFWKQARKYSSEQMTLPF